MGLLAARWGGVLCAWDGWGSDLGVGTDGEVRVPFDVSEIFLADR